MLGACWCLVSVSFVVTATANAFVRCPMSSSRSSCNARRSSDDIMTIDGDDDAAHQQQLSRRMKQSIESKPAAAGTRQKRLGHLDDDSDSDEGFEVMRQKLKPAARTNTKEKKKLNHLPDNDSDDDDFEVMRQKLREMQNSKVKEMERRKRDGLDSTARARTISATVGTGSKKQTHAKKQAKVKSTDVETTTAPVATLSTAVTSSVVDNTTVAPVSATVTTSESMEQSPAKKEQIMRERNNDVKATAAPVARSSVAVVGNAAVETSKQSSSKYKQEVIELLDDSDSDDDNPVPKLERKRKARPSASSLEDEVSSMGISAIKQELETCGISTKLFIEKSELVNALVQARREGSKPITKKQDDLIPFHLFATSSSKRISQDKRKYFKTLRQVIGLDVPNRQLKWLVVSNFALDFGYLLEQTLPDILQFHRVVVFYSDGRNSDAMARWRELLRGSGNTVEFVQLDPSAPANSRTNPLPVQIEYGLHHTKMFLTGYDEIVDGNTHSMIRVAVHTSNLLRGDNEMKANGAYTQNFPLKHSRASRNAHKRMKSNDTEPKCLFGVDLARYLESYGYTKRQQWCPTTTPLRDKNVDLSRGLSSTEFSLPELIRQYDYSSAYAVLIPSIPGRHKIDAYHNFGYLKLRKAIMDSFPASTKSANKPPPPVLCQMSSLGYLNQKYLGKFHEAIDYTSTHSTRPVQDYDRVSKNKPPLQNQLRIVWPTVDEIRNSVEGYYGGGSVCGKKKNVSLEFLQPLYRRWSNVAYDPLQTARHVPHIKSFVQPSHDGRSIEWICLTSHNLSIAAWGQVQRRSKNLPPDEKILFVRHWELGVFFSADTLARSDGNQVRIVPLADYEHDSNGAICLDNDEDEGDDDVIRVPLPYSLNTPAYAAEDNPWTEDPVFYPQRDAYGRHGLL